MRERTTTNEVLQLTQKGWECLNRHIVTEIPLTIYLNDKEIVTLLCTGAHLKALSVGFLVSEGLIEDVNKIESISLEQDETIIKVITSERLPIDERQFMKRIITSGCGKGTIFYHAMDSLKSHPIMSSLEISADQILLLMKELHERSELYKLSRGVHNCALAEDDKIIIFREDIGRHNAVDMILGHCFLNTLSLHDKVLLTTGRLTSEIVIKVAKMGIPLLISRNASTTLAMTIAERVNMTLIGLVRTNKMTVYTGFERIRKVK